MASVRVVVVTSELQCCHVLIYNDVMTIHSSLDVRCTCSAHLTSLLTIGDGCDVTQNIACTQTFDIFLNIYFSFDCNWQAFVCP